MSSSSESHGTHDLNGPTKDTSDVVARLDHRFQGIMSNTLSADADGEIMGTGAASLEMARHVEALISSLVAERDEARSIVAEANNCLYGSHAYFHSLQGGPFNKYHLARGIEHIKDDYREAERLLAEARATIAEIADFGRDEPLAPDTVRLIRIAGAYRRAALSEGEP